MMKIRMQVIIDNTKMVVFEEYDLDNDQDPRRYAQDLIDSFNNTLKPHESPRTLESVTVLGTKAKPTERINLSTEMTNDVGSYEATRSVSKLLHSIKDKNKQR